MAATDLFMQDICLTATWLENLSILCCDAIYFLMFKMNVVPSPSGSSGPRRPAVLTDVVHYIFICVSDQGGATVRVASEGERY